MKAHKFAEAIPEMTPSEYSDLKADIKANGQTVPIVLFQDEILDGRNRYRAMKELRMEPKFQTFRGTEVDAAAKVISLNIMRRHLTIGQRGLILAATLYPMLKEQAKKNQSKSGGDKVSKTAKAAQKNSERKNALTASGGKAAAIAAKSGGLSTRSMEQSVKVNEKAKPEVRKAVAEGKMSLNTAVKTIEPVQVPVPEETESVKKARLAGLKSLDDIANLASLRVRKDEDEKTTEKILRRIASLYVRVTKESRERIKEAFDRYFSELDRYEEGFSEYQ